MDNILSHDRSNMSGSIGQHNYSTSRPKFRPLRIKALLDSCASDDDESEDKTQESDSDSNCEDPQALPEDEDEDDEPIFTNPHQHKEPLTKTNQENTGEVISDHSHPTEKHKSDYALEDEGQKTFKYINSKECVKIHTQSQEKIIKSEDKIQSTYSDSCPVNFHKTGLSDEPQSTSASYTLDYNINIARNLNSGSTNNMLLSNEKVSQTEQDDSYNKNLQEKGPHSRKSSTLLSAVSENQTHVNKVNIKHGSYSVIHGSKNSENEPPAYNRQRTNSLFESADSIYGIKDKHVHLQKLSICETPCDQAQPLQSDHQVTDTPLKHAMSTSRPNPCLSHRNIFQTPQSKIQNTIPQSHAPTPATILSHWSQNTMGQTPLQSRVFHSKSNMQTPTQSVFAPIRHETPRYFGMDRKSTRRPLVDTGYTSQHSISSNNSAHQPELKSHYSHQLHLPKVEEIPCNNHFEQHPRKNLDNISGQSKDMIDSLERKNMHSVTNSQGEMKENDQPNIPDTPLQIEQPQLDMALKSKRVVIGSNVNINKKEVLEAYKKDDGVMQVEHKKLSNQCPTPSNRKSGNDVSDSNSRLCKESNNALNCNQSNKEVKQAADQKSGIQCSISSSIKHKQRKTIFVKNKEYLVLGTLGQGMSGEVLRVQDLSSSELRAIKCVNLSCMEKDAAQGCLEEISMLHKLQAPCVVRMFDYEVKPPMVYVLMEMGDTDLSRLLKSMSQEKQLPLTMILYYWTEMLTAVKHIHDNGVIHSDLKPANFLLVRGRLKLIDFGIASSMNPDATSVVKNCPIGTLNYISPEALMDIGGNGDNSNDVKYKITFKSDVWSLGCILYSLVYGHTPFQHIRSQWAKINAITNPKPNISFPVNVPPANSRSNSSFPPPILVDVMKKCLQHDPKARPTVTQLLQIQYVPTKPPAASVSPDILVKIKNALNEDEWRLILRILEDGRHT